MGPKYGKGVKARYGIRPKKTAARRRKEREEDDHEKRFFQLEKDLELARKKIFKNMKITKEAVRGGSSSSHDMNISSEYVIDSDCDYEDDHEEVHETTFSEQAKTKRKEFWRENSRVLKDSFLESFEPNGYPNEHLTSLDDSKLPTCDCIKSSIEITVYTLFGMTLECQYGSSCHVFFNVTFIDQFVEKIEYCSVHRPLLQNLILLQVVPSATDSPKYAIHFSVFEFATFAKLGGYTSNHAFAKVLNNYNAMKHKHNVIQKASSNLFNNLFAIYRNAKRHAVREQRDQLKVGLKMKCEACDGTPRKSIVMDGNFSLKRKANTKIQEYREGIFAASQEETEIWGDEAKVEKFSKVTSETKKEECVVKDLDSDFKAASNNHRKKGERFDENSVFAVSCSRHGCAERLYDISGGEGYKYAIASVDHVVKNMPENQKNSLIVYDIVCLCNKRMEDSIPKLAQLNPIYAVTAFHAYAHSMSCQMSYNPKYLEIWKADGESCKCVWSYANHFVGMICKAIRTLLLLEVVENYTDHKMMELLGPTILGLNYIQVVAVMHPSTEDVRVEYLILAAQLLILKEKLPRHEYHVSETIDVLDRKLTRIELENGFERPRSKDDATFAAYPRLIGMLVEGLRKTIDKVIETINKFVDDNFDGDETMKKRSSNRELQKMRKYIEEVGLLKEEAKRFKENMEAKMTILCSV
ncbi:hypothetical protein [Parasitella parasitica]|uniref:CxC1-like cysteine cluster associated with KDZ transposases domain-containing protein n=1 Tax=Parasitella parasitica TaxID=35722 RepID=A0A0B7NTC2_9FUNG|nr:hypothetical protein [Parasitella parasitica]